MVHLLVNFMNYFFYFDNFDNFGVSFIDQVFINSYFDINFIDNYFDVNNFKYYNFNSFMVEQLGKMGGLPYQVMGNYMDLGLDKVMDNYSLVGIIHNFDFMDKPVNNVKDYIEELDSHMKDLEPYAMNLNVK